MTYPKVSHTNATTVSGQPGFPALEEAVLSYWDADGTFQASIDQRDAEADGEFVFYDGPPFANGLPHYGHLLTGYVKDLIPRFQTMRGRRVERRFGWDTHGLPAELEAMRQLGIKTTDEIVRAIHLKLAHEYATRAHGTGTTASGQGDVLGGAASRLTIL